MDEKLLYELRITETDDGYRIELKGDKEILKRTIIGRFFAHPMAPPTRHAWRPGGFGPRRGRPWSMTGKYHPDDDSAA
jgi:hypothetical protein